MITNAMQDGVQWDRLLYPLEIEKLLGEIGKTPVSLRPFAGGARLFIVGGKDYRGNIIKRGKKRLAVGVLDEGEMMTSTRRQQLDARDLRQAMERAVGFSDAELTRHIFSLRQIPNGGIWLANEIMVFQTEQQLRVAEVTKARTLLECRNQASDGDPLGAIERFRSLTGCGLKEAYDAVTAKQ